MHFAHLGDLTLLAIWAYFSFLVENLNFGDFVIERELFTRFFQNKSLAIGRFFFLFKPALFNFKDKEQDCSA